MNKLSSKDWLYSKRTVRFGETDGAGVMHFVQLLKWCHETWEESLEKFGISLGDVFPSINTKSTHPETSLPIVHCEAKYFEPFHIGDNINIELYPEKVNSFSFVLRFQFKKNSQEIAMASIKHISINSISRKRCPFSQEISLWLKESTSDSPAHKLI